MEEQRMQYAGLAGTAGVRLSKNKFLVASESGKSLQVFNSRHSGRHLQQIATAKFLDLGVEAGDFAASANLNGICFAVSSHMRNADGALDRRRHNFVAWQVKGKKKISLRQLGHSYRRLADDLITASPLAQWTDEDLQDTGRLSLASDAERSLEIRGLAPYNGGVVLGFQSPLAEKQAILIPLINPLEMVMFDSAASFGEPVLLDLDGRGILSIDYWPQRNCYLISAGAHSHEGEPAYYLWNGKRTVKPRQLRLTASALGLIPESILFPSRNRMLIVGHGRRKNGGNDFQSLLLKVS